MTSGPHRRGRRDNGLEASSYAAAADVDPRVGEHLLDVLGLAGIAAYLQPAADLHPVTRTTMLPNRPTDRLFVDRDHLAEARGYVDQLRSDERAGSASGKTGDGAGTPDPTRATGGFPDATAPAGAEPATPAPPAPTGSEPEPAAGGDLEAEWARIVAEFDAPLEAPVPPWPVLEDVPDQPTETEERPGPKLDPPAKLSEWRVSAQRPLMESLDSDDTFEEDEEGYEPPPPPPIPKPSRYTALALLAIAAGLLLFFWPSLLTSIGFDEKVTLGLGVLGILVGFGTLVWRLRSGDEEEDDPDDGAVV